MKKSLVAICTIILLITIGYTNVFAGITVTGTGTVTFSPNMVNVQLGVRTQHEDISQALSENNTAIDNIVAALGELGIGEDHIQTSSFFIFRMGDWSREGEFIETNAVENIISVSLENMDLLNTVIQTGVDLGANNVFGINFDNSNRNEYYNQALQLAIQNGRTKAGVMAAALGQTLGQVTSAEEEINFAWGWGVGYRAVAGEAAASPDVNILPPGELSVTANVRMVFE